MISDIPRMFANADTKDFGDKFKYSFDTRESIFITGLCGTGKTHLAVALGKYAMENKNPEIRVSDSRFINYPEFVIDVKCSFGEAAHKSMQRLISGIAGGFIILDDICTSKAPTPIDVDTLYLIVNDRYQGQIPTIYTSNLSIEEIKSLYNDRISSRLSACRIIKLNGNDRRIK